MNEVDPVVGDVTAFEAKLISQIRLWNKHSRNALLSIRAAQSAIKPQQLKALSANLEKAELCIMQIQNQSDDYLLGG